MAEAFAPFIVKGTMCNLTFYVMEGRNFVRKKSSLTRRNVLYAPQFENTRCNAGLMGQASKIGSKLYAQLPRQYAGRPVYQYLTGLALQLLKQDINEEDILAELLIHWKKLLPYANHKQ